MLCNSHAISNAYPINFRKLAEYLSKKNFESLYEWQLTSILPEDAVACQGQATQSCPIRVVTLKQHFLIGRMHPSSNDMMLYGMLERLH